MIAIIDYNAGNLTSVRLAFDSVGVESEITQDPARILAADRVVFPGDGAAGSAMQHLSQLDLIGTIRAVVERGTPFLGICLGTQIIFEHSDENDGITCLGILPGNVRRFEKIEQLIKIPQMGWNTVNFVVDHPLFKGIENDSEFYFIHSYYPAPARISHRLAETSYSGATFASIVGRDNVLATQFHPERSGRIGLNLLANFTQWDGKC